MYLELSTTGDAVDTEVQPKRFDLGVPVSSVVERFVCPYRLTLSFGFGVVSASRSPSMNCKPARSTRGDAHRHVHRTPSNVTESHRHHRGHGGQEVKPTPKHDSSSASPVSSVVESLILQCAL